MKFKDRLRIRAALAKHQRGKPQEAMQLYQEMYQEGVVSASYMLPYSVLLMRQEDGPDFQLIREILVKAQKAPDLSSERRQQLLMNYAITVWKQGEMDRAISTLEASHRSAPNSLTYQSLGYLYIEAGDVEKALAYNEEALEYDDEDPITLDNLGQLHYRLLNDKEKAKEYFIKAHALKPRQIDTLYFLAKYDLEAGNPEQAIERLETALEGNFSPLNHVSRAMCEALLEQARNSSQGTQG